MISELHIWLSRVCVTITNKISVAHKPLHSVDKAYYTI